MLRSTRGATPVRAPDNSPGVTHVANRKELTTAT